MRLVIFLISAGYYSIIPSLSDEYHEDMLIEGYGYLIIKSISFAKYHSKFQIFKKYFAI